MESVTKYCRDYRVSAIFCGILIPIGLHEAWTGNVKFAMICLTLAALNLLSAFREYQKKD